MKTKRVPVAACLILIVSVVLQAWPSGGAAPVKLVAGVGAWNNAGRVSTLEMVGLNPQPEPPSRTAFLLHTSGASAVVITISCATTPAPRTYLATGRGSNGRWYQIRIKDNGFSIALNDRVRDVIGIASHAFPPNPCSDPGNASSVLAGDFIVR